MHPLHQFLEIPVGDGYLAASLHAPEPGRYAVAAPVVICAHGLTGTRVGSCYRFVRLARKLVEINIACLRIDFRGCGESSGCFQEVTPVRLVEDLLAAAGSLNHAAGCDPTRLGIVASSYGAFTTSLAIDRLDAVRSLVFWAPVADPRKLVDRDMTPQAWDFIGKHGWIDHFGMRMGRDFIDGLPDGDAPGRLAASPRPLLVMHGKGDKHVPIDHGRAYIDAMRVADGNSKLIEMDADDHGMRSVANNDRLLEETVSWCRRFLHPES